MSTLSKLRAAAGYGAIVITTPPSIKSMMLNFVEALVNLTDPHSRRYADRELKPETEVWADVHKLFRTGVCIMDEVDWVLHPLKACVQTM